MIDRQKLTRTHQWIDERSLALDKAIVQKLLVEPELVQRAKDNLRRWVEQRQPTVPRVLVEWQEVLDTWPFERIIELLSSSAEEACRLRQSSPFCGILSEEERAAIFREYEALRA